MDPRERFTTAVADYERYRPEYPAELFDWIVRDAALTTGSRVIDIGCGTGISTRALASRGLRVLGVDPNEAMLNAARSASGEHEIRWLKSDAETLELDERFDAIVGGQSFHWLDLSLCFPRFRALLKAEGRVIAFWNLRDARVPLMRDYEALLLDRCPEYARVGAEPRAHALLARNDLADTRRAEFEGQTQSLDRAAFHGRVWSSSYVLHSIDAAARPGFDRALDALFDRYATEDRVEFVYRTLAIGFSLRG